MGGWKKPGVRYCLAQPKSTRSRSSWKAEPRIGSTKLRLQRINRVASPTVASVKTPEKKHFYFNRLLKMIFGKFEKIDLETFSFVIETS